MIRAVVEATRAMLKIEFIKTTGIISEHLVLFFEEHKVDIIEHKQAACPEYLASYAPYSFTFETRQDNGDGYVHKAAQ